MLCITFHGLTGWLVSAVKVANCYGADAMSLWPRKRGEERKERMEGNGGGKMEKRKAILSSHC